MATTPRTHFDSDRSRAEALLDRALLMEQHEEPDRLVHDCRLAAVALSVGAMDAYLCDKYVD